MEYEPAGSEMPFWAQARLGGDESILTDQQTLRGYGTGRYVDNNLFVANMEVRTRVWDMDMFGTHGTLELAPFAEAGRVAENLNYNPVSQLHPVGGLGFRGIAQPFVVGYVDVGYGAEGASIFSGINYPF
jgi:hemolysin activation/secretion protein